MGNVSSVLRAGAGVGMRLAVPVDGRRFGSTAVVAATADSFLVLTLTAPGRLAMPGRRAGFFGVADFAAIFCTLALFLAATRATVFFLVAFPAALAVERAPAFALAAVRGRRFAALREAAFRIFAGVAASAVSSAMNRPLSFFISLLRRESAAVTSRIASLPSMMRA